MKKKAIQIFLKPDFHAVFKGLCAREGVAMSEKIKELMSIEVNHKVNPVSMGMPFDESIKHPAP